MLSSPLNLPFPFSQALTLLYSAHTLSLLDSLLHSLAIHPSPAAPDPYLLSGATVMSVKDTAWTQQKRKKKCTRARHLCFVLLPLPLSLPPALPPSASAVWVESAGRKKRGQKVRELQSVQKCFIAVMWRGWCGGWRGSNARAPVTWTDLDWQVTLLTCHCANTVYCTTTQTNMLNCNCPERPTQQTLVRICPEAMTV